MAYAFHVLSYCNTCYPLINEALNESVLLPIKLGKCDLFSIRHQSRPYQCEHVMSRIVTKDWTPFHIRLTNDSRRILLETIKSITYSKCV